MSTTAQQSESTRNDCIYKLSQAAAANMTFGNIVHALKQDTPYWKVPSLGTRNSKEIRLPINTCVNNYDAVAAAILGRDDLLRGQHIEEDHLSRRNMYFGRPIVNAAREGHDSTVQLLADQGCNALSYPGLEMTALEAAASQGHLPTVQLILRSVPDIADVYGQYYRALEFAANSEHIEMVEWLQHNSPVTPPASLQDVLLLNAARSGNEAIALKALERGACASVNAPVEPTCTAEALEKRTSGPCPLEVATTYDRPNIVRLLLEGPYLEVSNRRIQIGLARAKAVKLAREDIVAVLDNLRKPVLRAKSSRMVECRKERRDARHPSTLSLKLMQKDFSS